MLKLDIICMLTVPGLKLYYWDSFENELLRSPNMFHKIKTHQTLKVLILSRSLSKSRLLSF